MTSYPKQTCTTDSRGYSSVVSLPRPSSSSALPLPLSHLLWLVLASSPSPVLSGFILIPRLQLLEGEGTHEALEDVRNISLDLVCLADLQRLCHHI